MSGLKSLRSLSAWLVCAALLFATACSNSASKGEPSPSSAGAAAASATASPTAFATPPAEPVELTFFQWEYQKDEDFHKFIAEPFEAANPGYRLSSVYTPAADRATKLNTMLAAGNAPDIIWVDAYSTLGDLVKKGALVAADDRIQASGVDTGIYVNGLLAGMKAAVPDGKMYGLPFNHKAYNTAMLIYNKTIFDQAKVAYPQDNMTWPEVAELAKQVTSGSGSEKIYGLWIPAWVESHWKAAVDIQGGYWWNPQGDQFDSVNDITVSTAQFFSDLYQKDNVTMSWAEQVSTGSKYGDMFIGGKVAMMAIESFFFSRAMLGSQDGTIAFDWDLATFPTWSANPGVIPGNFTGVLAINAQSDNKDAAWKAIQYLSGEEYALFNAGLGGLTPVKTQRVLDEFKKNAGGKNIEAFYKVNSLEPRAGEVAPIVNAANFGKILAEEFKDRMLTGAITPEQATQNLNDRVNELLDQTR